MQKAAQYRDFADALTLAARDASPPTSHLMLELAQAWMKLAEEVEREDGGDPVRALNVIDFASSKALRAAKAG